MRHSALKTRTRRGLSYCRDSGSVAAGVAEDLLQQEFRAAAANRCCATDITYIRTTADWQYLVIRINLYSRRMFGWAWA